MALLSFELVKTPDDFQEDGNGGKTGKRRYIAKYDAPINSINDYETIPGLPAMFSVWSGTHNDTFLFKRTPSYVADTSRKFLYIDCEFSNTDEKGRAYGSLLDETYTKQGAEATGTRTYKIDSSYVDAAEAQLAPAVPQESEAWSNTRTGVLVVSHDSTRQRDGSYIVVANYASTTIEPEEKPQSSNPLEDPPIYTYTSNELETDIETDQVTGDLIKHTNNKPVFPLRKGREDVGVITVTRNVPFFSDERAQQFRGKTNNRIMQINRESFDEFKVYCKSIKGEQQRDEEDFVYYKETIVYWTTEDDWRDKIVNADFEDINGNKQVSKSGFEDTPTALDENGEFIEGDVAPEDRIINRPHRFKTADLQLMGV